MTYLHAILDRPGYVIALDVVVLLVLFAIAQYKTLVFILKSLSRNLLRTILTSLAVAVLVSVVTLVWTMLWFLEQVTTEKSKDLKAIVTEKWQLPSQMPFAYASSLADGAASRPEDARPVDHMTWQFFGATLDPKKRAREDMIFFFCMEPRKVLTMMDGLDEATPAELAELHRCIKLMEEDKRRVVMGRDKLKSLNKRVGERISLYSINYKDINLDDCEIIGVFPDGRYNQSAVMHCNRLNNALDDYKRKNGKAHPIAMKTLNIVWLKLSDRDTFDRVAAQISTSSLYMSPAVKCETASSGFASFLDAYRDLVWGMRWLLVPAILITMALVIANAISISVRERRTEMAVLKVLGYSPGQIVGIVLGEALLIGCASGFVSVAATMAVINLWVGGLKFPVGFIPAFMIPAQALWWGPLLGGLMAFAGSIVPAWSARNVKVAEVFSKIA